MSHERAGFAWDRCFSQLCCFPTSGVIDHDHKKCTCDPSHPSNAFHTMLVTLLSALEQTWLFFIRVPAVTMIITARVRTNVLRHNIASPHNETTPSSLHQTLHFFWIAPLFAVFHVLHAPPLTSLLIHYLPFLKE